LTRRLSLSGIHVWCAKLDLDAFVERAKSFQQLLSSDEVDRANLIEAENSRREFIINRGVLRVILSNYLAVEPRKLKFQYNQNGRPSLQSPQSALYSTVPSEREDIQFNLAHSHGLAVYAFSSKYLIGADVEWMNRPIEDRMGRNSIADRFFSKDERDSISRFTTRAKRRKAFFKLWTAKEAFLKARGENISAIMSKGNTVDFSIVLRKKRGVLGKADISKDQCFSYWQFEPTNPYIATVVREGASHTKFRMRNLLTEKQAMTWATESVN
jgi:4'-phosphopantetheinyl transferase